MKGLDIQLGGVSTLVSVLGTGRPTTLTPIKKAAIRKAIQDEVHKSINRGSNVTWLLLRMAMYDEWNFKVGRFDRIEKGVEAISNELDENSKQYTNWREEFPAELLLDKAMMIKFRDMAAQLQPDITPYRKSLDNINTGIANGAVNESRRKAMKNSIYDTYLLVLKTVHALYKIGNRNGRGRLFHIQQRLDVYIDSIAEGTVTLEDYMNCLHDELGIEFKGWKAKHEQK